MVTSFRGKTWNYFSKKYWIEGLLFTINSEKRFSVYNFGSGIEYSVKEIIDIIQNVSGTQKDVISEQEERKNEIMNVVADISQAKKDLNWQPTYKFEDGIRDIIKDLRSAK